MNETTKFLYTSSKCFTAAHAVDGNARNTLLTIIYASLIPLIISANLLLIFGIIKTKQNRFSSTQILFLTLFLSDFTFGVFQLPLEIYVKWRSAYPTCLEIKLARFSRGFPICMSGTILFAISIDRYINVAHNRFHTRFVTKKFLTTIIILVTLVSIMWALLDTLFSTDRKKTRKVKLYIALTVYIGTLIATGVVFNIALLKNVKQKTKNSSAQAFKSRLTKTIAIIAAILVISYLPLMITFATLALIKDGQLKKTIQGVFAWTLIPPQTNAVLNSVIYLTRNSRMRRYYYKLLNCESTKTHLQRTVFPVLNIRRQVSPAS